MPLDLLAADGGTRLGCEVVREPSASCLVLDGSPLSLVLMAVTSFCRALILFFVLVDSTRSTSAEQLSGGADAFAGGISARSSASSALSEASSDCIA